MRFLDLNGYGCDIFRHRNAILSSLTEKSLPREHFFNLLMSINVSHSIETEENVIVNLLESYVRFYSNEVSEKIRCILVILNETEDKAARKAMLLDALELLLRRSKGLPLKIQKSLRDITLTFIYEDGLDYTPYPDYEDVEDIPVDWFLKSLRVGIQYREVSK
ncbi:MAG: hypothetical protein AB2L14_00730 [Candidatus Xenobiia bacterium LiM19]